MKQLAENLWLLTYRLNLLGADLHRNVSIIRLNSGDLIIHSTGPFTTEDIAAIEGLGRPVWLVDAMLRHDTFAREGRAAFPNAKYLAPEGFSAEVGFTTSPILPMPVEWFEELDVIEVAGVPSLGEHVFFHRASRTLIVADLVFNFGPSEPFWTELMIHVAVGGEHHPGMSRPFKMAVSDEAAFKTSIEMILQWDFDRIIVGHGDVVETGGKQKMITMLEHAEFLPAAT